MNATGKAGGIMTAPTGNESTDCHGPAALAMTGETGNGSLCDGCRWLEYEQWPDRYAALCCDMDKPALGQRRALVTMERVAPTHIGRPAWCRGKESGA